MFTALLAAALTLIPAQDSNATPLRQKGRTVALTAAELDVTCVSCRLTGPSAVAQQPAPTPPPLVVPEDTTPPPLLDSEEQPPVAGELSPEPEAPQWQAPPERRFVPPELPSQYDRNTGDWVGKEVLAGALTLLVTDVVATGVIGAVLLVTLASSFGNGSQDFVGGFLLAGALALVHAALSPLWCAIAVKAISDEPTQNGLGGAALGAYVSALGIAGASFLVLVLVASAAQGATASGTESLTTVLTLGMVLARWIGVPMASSWALHRGTPRSHASAAFQPRRFAVISAAGREERPISGATVFRF